MIMFSGTAPRDCSCSETRDLQRTTGAMDLVKLSCAANNHGVSLLAAGESQASLFSFHRALTTVKRVAGMPDDVGGTDDAAKGSSSPSNCNDAYVVVEVDDTSCSLSLSSDDCYTYGRPLLIHPGAAAESDTSALAIYSAVILFNMALACHSVGRNGKASAYRRAAGLYAMTVQILSNEMEDCTFDGTRRLSSVLTLLALNNHAQILYHELCDYKLCRRCLKDMARLMQGKRASIVVPALQASLPGHDVEGIVLNLMLLKAPSAASAA